MKLDLNIRKSQVENLKLYERKVGHLCGSGWRGTRLQETLGFTTVNDETS